MKMGRSFQQDLDRVVWVIRRRYRPLRVVLFGSAAWGGRGRVNDLDLLILKSSRKPRHRRAADVYHLLWGVRRNHPVDLLVLTPGEFEQRLAMGDPFMRRIQQGGRVLYDAAA